jgi:dihydrolipoamide dehydrogenase
MSLCLAEAIVAREFAASVEDLALSAHEHPTLPEAIKEAALALSARSSSMTVPGWRARALWTAT